MDADNLADTKVDSAKGKLWAKQPAHVIIYEKIRQKVLYGDLKPGEAVTIHGLTDELEVSMTPVREAIRRLTAAGALEFQGNRRVCVPIMGPTKFRELTQARLAIEPKLAKMAARQIGADDISSLGNIDRLLDDAIEIGDVQSYMKRNHQFHFTLYQRANAEIFYALADTLWLRYGPISRIISGNFGTQHMPDRHQDVLNALRQNDPNGVADAIRSDIRQGFDIVKSSFDWDEI